MELLRIKVNNIDIDLGNLFFYTNSETNELKFYFNVLC